MPSNKRTIYLGLDYSDFTGGVTEVNRKMGLLDAEFKLAQEQAKNYGNETDVLGSKHDYLAQKIELQKQKVEAAKNAYDQAMSSQSASEKQIDALDKKLLQERTTLEKLEGQLRSTDEEQKQLGDDAESFGDAIRNMASSVGLEVSPALEKLASKLDGVSKQVGTAVVGIGAIIGGFINCSVEAAKMADDLLTLSSTTGIATDELQKLQYASDFVDVSVDTMAGSMQKLLQQMDKAAKGSKDTEEAFRKLHVRFKENNGQLRDDQAVFYDVIDALGHIANESERDALAMQLFGRSAKDLNPLIEAGSKKLKELGIEAEQMGVVMDGKDLEALGRLNDAMEKFDKTTEALKNSMGLVLLPMLTQLFETISSIPAPILQTLVVLASVVASIVLVVKAIKSITDTTSTIKGFFSMAQGGMSKTTLIIMGVVAALVALAAVIAVIMGKKDDLVQTMNSVNSAVGGMTGTVTDVQNGTYRASRNASGTSRFLGGRTWVGEEGPELVTLPGGSSITPASKMAGNEYNTYNITIDAHNVEDFQQVVALAKGQRMAMRRV